MSLKILIADDSMTAQNMGKKILVDAGFNVVPVSNGAAAIKKIAETKPDIIILDIYMPGYTGLEVCEKVKNAPETANVPVLLTVGKLEPYRPEEGAKVKAEGVIIKPFEASDLLSALGRIAQKYNLNVPQIEPVEIAQEQPSQSAMAAAAVAPSAPSAPAFEDTMRLSQAELQSMLAKGEQKHGIPAASAAQVEPDKHEVPSFIREATAAAAAPAPMFVIEENPDEISASAFNLNDLSIPSNEAPAYLLDEPVSSSHAEVAPEFGGVEPFSASSVRDEDPTASFSVAAESPVEEYLEAYASAAAAGEAHVEPELETTATAKVEANVENLAELETAEEVPPTFEPVTDPALVTNPDELMQFTVKVGTENETPVEPESVSDEVTEVASTPEESVAPAVEEAAASETETPVPSESEFQYSQHTYNDDPLVQMGVITIDHSADSHAEVASASFQEPEAEDDLGGAFQPASGLVGALHEFEAASEADTQVTEVPVETSHVETPLIENEQEAMASAPAEIYVEPEVEEEPVSELAPEASFATSVVAVMAAATPELDTPPQEHEIKSSLAAAVEHVTEEAKDEAKSLAASVGMDASLVARAVQRVFERYKEQMVADITHELSKGE